MDEYHWADDSLPAQQTVAVIAGDTAVVPRNESRVALVLCSSTTQAVTWSTATTAVFGQGVNLATGQLPLVLTLRQHGSIVKSAWRTATAGAGDNLTYIEVTNSCACRRG